MARPLRIEYPGAFYHVTSRGNERKEVFRSRKDREQFLGYLESATTRYEACVYAYCLMSNHYHLLVETPGGNLSQIMAHINGAYTTYFNTKRHRAGHLFQGRYKAILVEREEYAQELSRYIHLNAVRAKMVARPQDHEWSSYRAYVGVEPRPSWLVTESILSGFAAEEPKAQASYRDFVEGVIGKDEQSPLDKVKASTLLGSESFLHWIEEQFLKERPADRELPALNEISERPPLCFIRKAVEERFGGEPAKARRMALYLCHRYSGRKLREIGAEFGVTESAVTQASKRMARALAENQALRVSIDELRQVLPESKV